MTDPRSNLNWVGSVLLWSVAIVVIVVVIGSLGNTPIGDDAHVHTFSDIGSGFSGGTYLPYDPLSLDKQGIFFPFQCGSTDLLRAYKHSLLDLFGSSSDFHGI